MATKKKRQTVKELGHLFANSQVLIFTDYRGLKVSEITNLRRVLRDKGVEFHVTKNTLAELAAHRNSLDSMVPMLDGPTAIAFVGDDIPGAAKALTDFVRTSKILQIRGGLMGAKTITAEQVSDLTKILTKEQYISQLLGSMKAPIQNFVNVLNAPLQSFVNVLNARLDQMKEGGEGAAATAEADADADAGAAAEMTTDAGADASTEAAPEAPEAAEAAPEAAPDASAETEATTEAAPDADADASA
jgi:large subunit ribosomal protein L10